MERLVVGLDLADTATSATCEVAEIAGAQMRIAIVELASKRDVVKLQRPHLNVETSQQPEAGFELLVSGYRQIGMQKLLNHLG